MDLEARRQQLLSRMSALKQQEQSLESYMSANEADQSSAVDNFKNELTAALSSLSSLPQNFALASKQIDSLYSVASDLSFRIKEVDTAISRCTQAANYIRHFADLRECLGSIDKYIETKNIAKSCDSIHRLLQIPENLLTPDDVSKIDASRKETLALLQDLFETEEQPTQVFEYFNQVNAQKEAVLTFAEVHYKKILDEINEDRIYIIQLPPAPANDDTRAPHVEVYVKLLNAISSHVLGSILPLSDPGQFSLFIRILLEKIDPKMEEIITKYSEYRKLSELEIQSSSDINLSIVDLVNDEISIFAHQFALFENFLSQKLSKGIETPMFQDYEFKFKTAANTGLPMNTPGIRSIQEILAQYSVLTQSYINSVTGKLLKTVSLMDKTENVTDAIDDLFFVFQRTLNRSINTHSAPTTCTIFNVITSIIHDNLMQSIQAKKRFKSTDITGKYGVQINAFEVVGVYLNKLTALIETTIARQFTADDLTAIHYGLRDLKKCGAKLEEELNKHFDEMIQKLKPVALKLCDPFNSTVWMGSISVELETHLQKEFKVIFISFGDYKKFLNSTNYANLMKKLAEFFVERLETIFMFKQFDSNGAILMARMIKWVSNYFGNPPVFRRLKDIARILTLPSPEQLKSVWGPRATEEDPIEFELTELKKIVKLRIDWRDNDLGFLLEQ